MIRYFFLLFVVLCVTSCKVSEKIASRQEVPNITEGKLLKNIYENELVYNSLYAKKVDISLTGNGKKDNLKAVLKVKKDSFIWISLVAPLGIEVARVLLTQDSIKFVNSFNKKYFFTDYQFFYDKFDVQINFDCFQKLLTNVYFNLESCGKDEVKDSKFKFERTENDYVLSNVHRKALNRKIKKFFKKKKKNKEYTLILQKIHLDPELFRPIKISLEDLEDDMGVSVKYSDFKSFEEKIFPSLMEFNVSLNELKYKLELKFQKIEFDTDVVPNLRLSSKYKPISFD
ncbi:DUF4292 domain-containing protein [Odoribacter lunatus]|uniref:DUF4292 domain-containing protein n=1 Tax=Odoribacter lunatus TaxID=2941335 RepID=UPI00203E8D7F|nr:DUF4292 domain-containing protein [Odoribacter lunatus]